MIFALAPEKGEFRKQILLALKKAGHERKFGKAPASFMEREMQEWLEAILKN